MTIWRYVEPGPPPKCETIIHRLTEDEIIQTYFKYWSAEMRKAGLDSAISRQGCIDDFIVVHWAEKETGMFTKLREIQDPNSCLNRSANDEPVFVLVGRDKTAPDAIEKWCELAKAAGAPEEKIKQGLVDAHHMREWQLDHPESVKVPD